MKLFTVSFRFINGVAPDNDNIVVVAAPDAQEALDIIHEDPDLIDTVDYQIGHWEIPEPSGVETTNVATGRIIYWHWEEK